MRGKIRCGFVEIRKEQGGVDVECEDRVLDGPASGEKSSNTCREWTSSWTTCIKWSREPSDATLMPRPCLGVHAMGDWRFAAGFKV